MLLILAYSLLKLFNFDLLEQMNINVSAYIQN